MKRRFYTPLGVFFALAVCALVVFGGSLFAQEASLLDDAMLSKQKEFTSLEEALKDPAKVY